MTRLELRKEKLPPIKLHIFASADRLQATLSYLELGKYHEALKQAREATEEIVAAGALIAEACVNATGVRKTRSGKDRRK